MKYLSGKVVLVTGGTGSFGKQVLKTILCTDVSEIRVLSRDETKQEELRMNFPDPRIRYFLGDVRDISSVNQAMFGVNLIFHAAALKQVPSCEFFPLEAVKTNVFGTENVINSAVENGAEKVICLSTDKAAYPVNAMGMTKALMEKVALSKAPQAAERGTIVCCTRYGNVLGSRGSVAPLFVKQMIQGEELTYTDGSMTRFVMDLSEAMDLVLFAFEHGDPGDTLIQKAKSCTVSELGAAVSDVLGRELRYREMGLRHGEKMFEVLMTKEEASRSLDMGGYFKISADVRGLNYEQYSNQGDGSLEDSMEFNSNNCGRVSHAILCEKLLKLDSVKIALGG